jgi:antitoxin SocA-like protein
MANDSHNRTRELILYLAERSSDDPRFGRVKLAKLLFLSDFGAYGEFGESITGACYRKKPHGPMADEQLLAERDLKGSGSIEVQEVGRYMYTQKRIVAKRKAQIDWLSKDQLALVDEVIQRHWDDDATGLSNLSHAFPGYEIAQDGEEIPYHAVFISREPPSQEDIDWGLAKARELSLA